MVLLYMVQDQAEAHALLQWHSKAGEQTPKNASGMRCSCLGG